MGNCHKFSKYEQRTDKEYSRYISLDILCNNYLEKVNFFVKTGEKLSYFEYPIGKMNFLTSSCLLEGIDPRGINIKPCQDYVFVTVQGEYLLTGVFDGHGKHDADFEQSLKETLVMMVEECDRCLLNESKIDCSTSGTTAALILMTPDSIWSCSVGDSRAVLATLPKHPKVEPYGTAPRISQYRQQIIPHRMLKPVQLTLDQKPNISYELERIIKSGGVVSQVTGSDGKKIGPYRIWKPSGVIPGLAMSRSLGDSIAKNIGVISKPVVYQLEICIARDQFVVIASDGVWDVMDNLEVINFVDKYKEICTKVPDYNKKLATEANSVIAELLCEEARYRWLGICKDEDVAIDDISAVVIQFKPKTNVAGIIKRKGITVEQSLDIDDDQQIEIRIDKRFDIKRGSNAAIQEEDEEAEED